jgi:hypothetical protein
MEADPVTKQHGYEVDEDLVDQPCCEALPGHGGADQNDVPQ